MKHPPGPPMTLGNGVSRAVHSWGEPDAFDVGKGAADPEPISRAPSSASDFVATITVLGTWGR